MIVLSIFCKQISIKPLRDFFLQFSASLSPVVNSTPKAFSVGWTAKKVKGFHYTSVLVPIDKYNLPALIHIKG